MAFDAEARAHEVFSAGFFWPPVPGCRDRREPAEITAGTAVSARDGTTRFSEWPAATCKCVACLHMYAHRLSNSGIVRCLQRHPTERSVM